MRERLPELQQLRGLSLHIPATEAFMTQNKVRIGSMKNALNAILQVMSEKPWFFTLCSMLCLEVMGAEDASQIDGTSSNIGLQGGRGS